MADKNSKGNGNVLLALWVIVFIISAVLSIAGGIVFIVHAFRNPDMTFTQLTIWMMFDTKWWIPLLALIASYVGMAVENGKL